MGDYDVAIGAQEAAGASILSSLHVQRSHMLEDRKALAVLERETMLENKKLQHEQLRSVLNRLRTYVIGVFLT
jgi:hypothetical protein